MGLIHIELSATLDLVGQSSGGLNEGHAMVWQARSLGIPAYSSYLVGLVV